VRQHVPDGAGVLPPNELGNVVAVGRGSTMHPSTIAFPVVGCRGGYG
jgi:hypothetical protein